MQKTAVRELSHVGVAEREAVKSPFRAYSESEYDESDEYQNVSDPFYSESNLAYLRRSLTALNNGEGIERDIIEVAE